MSKLLIYIGEKQIFDLERTIQAIMSIEGVSNARRGRFIGAVFECEYTFGGENTIARISEDMETVTVEGLGRDATEFAVRFQQQLGMPLRVIDMEYSFDLHLSDFASGEELSRSIAG
jgi:hypothetical protein